MYVHILGVALIDLNSDVNKTYSINLRRMIVWQRDGLGLSNQVVAYNLGINPFTVSRIVSLFKATVYRKGLTPWMPDQTKKPLKLYS